jgi:redox-sensitive bicupin YhaK (pirin superfamily)
MIKKFSYDQLGNANYGWLDTKYHFSFANYFDPKRMSFGSLRVINDDIINPKTGFDTHPHQNMEILTYVIDGHLTHGDSMKNKEVISRGHFQYMSAGTGVYHSEHNRHDDPLRLMQIWILPDQDGYKPDYGDFRPNWNERVNKWLHVASSKDGEGTIKVHQDINMYVTETNIETRFEINQGRQAYLVNLEGDSIINGHRLNHGDALEIIEENIVIQPNKTSHILIIEMKKENK